MRPCDRYIYKNKKKTIWKNREKNAVLFFKLRFLENESQIDQRPRKKNVLTPVLRQCRLALSGYLARPFSLEITHKFDEINNS